jgi:hypothetical protein
MCGSTAVQEHGWIIPKETMRSWYSIIRWYFSSLCLLEDEPDVKKGGMSGYMGTVEPSFNGMSVCMGHMGCLGTWADLL